MANARHPSLQRPLREGYANNVMYDAEIRFRRELESYLNEILELGLAVANGVNTNASHAQKRSVYFPPVGSASG